MVLNAPHHEQSFLLPDGPSVTYVGNDQATNASKGVDFRQSLQVANPQACIQVIPIHELEGRINELPQDTLLVPGGGDSTHRFCCQILLESGRHQDVRVLPSDIGRTNEIARNLGMPKGGYRNYKLDNFRERRVHPIELRFATDTVDETTGEKTTDIMTLFAIYTAALGNVALASAIYDDGEPGGFRQSVSNLRHRHRLAKEYKVAIDRIANPYLIDLIDSEGAHRVISSLVFANGPVMARIVRFWQSIETKQCIETVQPAAPIAILGHTLLSLVGAAPQHRIKNGEVMEYGLIGPMLAQADGTPIVTHAQRLYASVSEKSLRFLSPKHRLYWHS